MSAAAVALILLAAAVGIAFVAAREIQTPHQVPAPWTLGVLVAVIILKGLLSRRVSNVGVAIGSTAVRADAWHHLSDALTSAAAFIGISIALWGSRYRGGTGWESADDWAALVASVVIAFNALLLMRPALRDLMDRMPGDAIVGSIRKAAEEVPGVLAIEKLAVRKAGWLPREPACPSRTDDAARPGARPERPSQGSYSAGGASGSVCTRPHGAV